MGSDLWQAQIPGNTMTGRSLCFSDIFLSQDHMRLALRMVLTYCFEGISIISDLRQDFSRGRRLMCDSDHPYLNLNIASGLPHLGISCDARHSQVPLAPGTQGSPTPFTASTPSFQAILWVDALIPPRTFEAIVPQCQQALPI